MGAITWEDTPVEMQVEFGESRTIDAGGMTVAFERWQAGLEVGPLFKGLPDDACQSPHWGYLVKGRLRITNADGSEYLIEPGQAYYMPPGHIPHFDEDVELIEFSPTEARRKTMEHAARAMESMQAEGAQA
jgi:hypothetical protein